MPKNKKSSGIAKLLLDSPESYYWIGFLMADGHFSQKRIKVHLASQDADHVYKFAQFIEYTGDQTNCLIVMDSVSVPLIKTKFGISNQKTWTPCRIATKHDRLFISLLIGFIDGDGCIRRLHNRSDCSIDIKCHRSWMKNLQYMSERVAKILGLEPVSARPTNSGYARLVLSDNRILKYLKKSAVDLHLPFMRRKWEIVDEQRVSRTERAKENEGRVKDLLAEGERRTDIARLLGLTNGAITGIIKRLEKKNGLF